MKSSGTEFIFKIILIGDPGVGKTNLFSRFARDQFDSDPKSTIGVEFATKTLEVEGKTVRAQIWDTAGQERFGALVSAYYRGAVGALLLYDISASSSFNSLSRWLQELREKAGSSFVVMLAGNKCDLQKLRAVSTNQGIEFSKRENLLFIETSARDATNVKEAFTTLITEIVHRLLKKDIGKSKQPDPTPKPQKDNSKEKRANEVDNKEQEIQHLNEQIKSLQDRLSKYENAESENIPKHQAKPEVNVQNFFIGDDEEKFHKIVKKIGEGATSVAYKIIDTQNNRVMCKKVLKADEKHATFEKLQNSFKEFSALIGLHHPCICRAIGFNMQEKVIVSDNKTPKAGDSDDQKQEDYEYEDDENVEQKVEGENKTTVALFIEFLSFKLSESLEKGILNNTLKVRVAVEVAFGMQHIHSQGMMHRDLKVENIMLNDAYNAKIIDFDLVHFAPDEDEASKSLTKGIGTLAYMSPEMSKEEEYDNKTDVYSFGIVLFVIFAGHLPKQTLKDKMTNEKPIRFPHSSPSITKYCIQLIKRCIEFDPKKRPSFSEIIEDMKAHNFALAEEVDLDIINERYQFLDNFRNQHFF